MLQLDRDYLALKPILDAECKRRKIEFRFEELNPQGWGDTLFLGIDGIHCVEIKQSGEAIGDMDHLITQIKNQAENCQHLWLFIYGEMRRAEDGNSYSLRYDKGRESWASKAGLDTGWVEEYTRRYHRVNWDGQRKILWRLREVGVQVVEVRNLEELASELCLLYEAAQTEGSTFTRLIKEKIRVAETDPSKATFMKTLMGIDGARIGEEIARAIADGLEYELPPRTFAGLLAFTNEEEGRWEAIADWKLASGKRIGDAAVARLKAALGI